MWIVRKNHNFFGGWGAHRLCSGFTFGSAQGSLLAGLKGPHRVPKLNLGWQQPKFILCPTSPQPKAWLFYPPHCVSSSPKLKQIGRFFFWWHFSPVFSIKKTGCLLLTHSFSLDGLFLVKKKSNKGPHWNCWNLCAFCVTVRRFLCELCAGGPSVCSADSVWYLSCQGQVLQQEENFRHF